MRNDSGDIIVGEGIVEQSGVHYNFAAGHAHCSCTGVTIRNKDHVPIEPTEMRRLWPGSQCLAGLIQVRGDTEHDSVVMVHDAEATVSGMDDLASDETDTHAVRVERVEDVGSHLLLVLGEIGLAELAFGPRRGDDEVRAVGAGHELEVAVAEGHQRGARGQSRQGSDLPWIVVPPAAPGRAWWGTSAAVATSMLDNMAA